MARPGRGGRAAPVRAGARGLRGRLAWTTDDIDGDHVVAVLSARVSDDDLALLRDRGASCLLAGADDVALPLSLAKIGESFGVRTLMLEEGGGWVNGGILRAGLVDEVSVHRTTLRRAATDVTERQGRRTVLADVPDGRSRRGRRATGEASVTSR